MAQNNSSERANREVTFEIMQHFGILSTSPRGWTKELNLVSWNENKPKYDLRDWDGEHRKMSRGITLTDEETSSLLSVLSGISIGSHGEDEDRNLSTDSDSNSNFNSNAGMGSDLFPDRMSS